MRRDAASKWALQELIGFANGQRSGSSGAFEDLSKVIAPDGAIEKPRQ